MKPWVVLVIILAVVFLLQSGSLDNIFGGDGEDDTGDGIFPSDLKTTITLNTKDGLATTSTDANVNYYVFKSNNGFLKSGTTASGTGSFTVPIDGSYKLVAFDDDGSGSDWYPVDTTFTTIKDESEKTINLQFLKESNATVNLVRDPVDLNSNISVGLGQSVNYDLLFSVTTANAVVHNPVIVVDVNQTTVDDVSLAGLPKVGCPTRLTTGAQRKKICFAYGRDVKASDGIITLSGALLFSSSNTPATADNAEFNVIDTQGYLDPDYISKGYSAFHQDTENKNTYAIVGATDSDTGRLDFAG